MIWATSNSDPYRFSPYFCDDRVLSPRSIPQVLGFLLILHGEAAGFRLSIGSWNGNLVVASENRP